jgi:hypothetical protein
VAYLHVSFYQMRDSLGKGDTSFRIGQFLVMVTVPMIVMLKFFYKPDVEFIVGGKHPNGESLSLICLAGISAMVTWRTYLNS